MLLTTQGIILREVNYKEADKILTVLTRDYGKRTVKAPGCRRKTSRLTAGSQLLVYSELTLRQRGEYLTLSEADPQQQFWSVRQDLDLLALASYFAEVTEAAAQEAGLYILVAGNDEISDAVTVTAQSVAAGEKVPRGTTVRLEFTDTKAAD